MRCKDGCGLVQYEDFCSPVENLDDFNSLFNSDTEGFYLCSGVHLEAVLVAEFLNLFIGPGNIDKAGS